MPSPVVAVFLDRDGTINEEVDYLDDPERCRLLPGAGAAIRRLNESGLSAIIVTNQAGIGRGYFTVAQLDAVHDRLTGLLSEAGARVDGLYVCPHHPDDSCRCRKPRTGLVERAAAERGLDLAASFFVGDKASDIQAGAACGCRTILVRTGYGDASLATLGPRDVRPTHVADDLAAAVGWILTQHDDHR